MSEKTHHALSSSIDTWIVSALTIALIWMKLSGSIILSWVWVLSTFWGWMLFWALVAFVVKIARNVEVEK